MFVATANTLNIPEPLLDRMEIIRLPGYTEQEKIDIALTHLVPKQLKAHGLKRSELNIAHSAVKSIIQFYTREAGVRRLEQEIAKICRKSVKQLLTKKKTDKVISYGKEY
jgi:ATP-dependent Lon protease